MPNPALSDPLVIAAKSAFESEWRALGSPSPTTYHPELEAARRVYHAVLEAASVRWSQRGEPKLVAI